MPKAYVRGSIIPNDYKWIYDWFDMDSTCPNDIQKAIDQAAGQTLDLNGHALPTGQIYQFARRCD